MRFIVVPSQGKHFVIRTPPGRISIAALFDLLNISCHLFGSARMQPKSIHPSSSCSCHPIIRDPDRHSAAALTAAKAQANRLKCASISVPSARCVSIRLRQQRLIPRNCDMGIRSAPPGSICWPRNMKNNCLPAGA